MDSLFGKVGSAFFCGALIFALLPVNTGLSTNGVGGCAPAPVPLNKYNVSNESSKSLFKGNKGENIENKVNINEKKAEKTPGGNKNMGKKDETPLENFVKVGAAVWGSNVLFGLSQFAVNKIKNKSKRSDTINEIYLEDIERELEEIKNERDQLKNERDKAINEKNDIYNALPGGTRAWLFGICSYLWGHLGIFGEGKRETKVLAEHDAGLRILLSISGFVFFLIVFVLYYSYDYYFTSKSMSKICVLVTFISPPIGTVLTAGNLFYKYRFY